MYKKKIHLHFVGIGGIGMSGIAEIVKRRGYIVSGCDVTHDTELLHHLAALGCPIYHEHHPDHLKNVDVVVYSSALSQESPEIKAALAQRIPVIPRALMLAELMRTKYSVAVSGSHGKTTTTSMISHVLIEAQKDPTVIVGGRLKNIATHAKIGHGELLIAEADESDRSFLFLNPTMAVVTNIDAEHLDTYKDLDDVRTAFKNFLARVPFYGKGIVCIDDPEIRAIMPLHHIRTVTYGTSSDADVRGIIISMDSTGSTFEVTISPHVAHECGLTMNQSEKHMLLGTITLRMPGIHNIRNALAAVTLALECDIPFATIQTGLASFSGVERRFEFKGICNGAEVFDDYGHHPTELHHTFLVAAQRTPQRLMVVFQPHRYSRTHHLWDDFVHLFGRHPIHTLYLADIYPASESPIDGVTSSRLRDAIAHHYPTLNVVHLSSYDDIVKTLAATTTSGDLVLTIGAGKVNLVAEQLLERSLNREG
jgi:UDP-N-acetylmuramate--alanine ligase